LELHCVRSIPSFAGREFCFGLLIAGRVEQEKAKMKTEESNKTREATMPPVSFPELLDPSFFFSDRILMGTTFNELLLQWAVLSDGLKRYCALAENESCHTSEDFLQEEAWLMADEKDWLFSFASLCRQFGVEPESLRGALLKWKSSHLSDATQNRKEQKSMRGFSPV
jgi:hypothetical protein